MRKRFLPSVLGLLLVFPLAGLAQHQPRGAVEVTFPNGIHLRIISQQNLQDVQGVLRGELAVKSLDVVHRLFRDRQNGLEFGYDIAAVPKGRRDGVLIQIKPLDASVLSVLHEQRISPSLNSRGQLHTFERERELGPVRPGDRVSLDVLTNPITGEKVADLIEVVEASEIRHGSIAGAVPRDKSSFVLTDVRAWLDGKEVTGGQSLRSISGRYPVLYIPDHGSFFIALEPQGDLPFVRAGIVDGTKLEFAIGQQSVKCVSRVSILSNDAVTAVWVWHAPKYRPSIPELETFVGRVAEDSFQVAVADSIEVWRSLVKP